MAPIYSYLPPETNKSPDKGARISTAIDIWSMGVIFYELVYGRKVVLHFEKK